MVTSRLCSLSEVSTVDSQSEKIENQQVYELMYFRNRHIFILKFTLGFRYIIIFLYVQFWIRLDTVSYRGKKVRTVDSPVVRSVNTSSDTRNCVQKRAKLCDLCPLRHSFIWKSPRNCFVCSDKANTPQLQSSWWCQCEVTGHRKMSALGTAGAMVHPMKIP